MLSHTACLVGEARGSTAFNGAGGILNIDGQGKAMRLPVSPTLELTPSSLNLNARRRSIFGVTAIPACDYSLPVSSPAWTLLWLAIRGFISSPFCTSCHPSVIFSPPSFRYHFCIHPVALRVKPIPFNGLSLILSVRRLLIKLSSYSFHFTLVTTDFHVPSPMPELNAQGL